ncbi:hypothetical protein I4U23_018438 [Adineta vaga]|nr:hypothetical protein I4U23_018438 [Adineta vaga]
MISVVSSVNAASIDSLKSLTAADKLRDLLIQLDNGDPPLSPPLLQSSSPKIPNDFLESSDLHILAQTADEINNRLKDENKALQNNRLYEEMRSTFVSDMLRLINMDDGRQHTSKESQLVDLYTKKMRSLEIEFKEAKEKLNMYETAWHAPNELMNCLKCGAFLPFNQHSLEHNERFADMIEENETNKHKILQMQVKVEKTETNEQKVLAKLQESLVITERCQMEKAEAIVERDLIQRELIETQKRLNKLIEEINEKVTNETRTIEIICRERLKDSEEKIQKTEDKCSQYELIIDRLAREKTSLAADLDVWKECIQRQELDLSQTTDAVKLQIQKAMRERDEANANTMQIRSNFEQFLLQSNQDFLQLRYQLSSTQNRLHDIESELLNSKKQCLDLTEEINQLTRENLMLKNVKQTLEQSREENLDAIVVILKQREEDHCKTIEKLDLERQQSLSHLEDLVQHQNTILNKLRLYSRDLTNEIERILQRKNAIVQEITIENQELRMKLSNAYERLDQTDTQLTEHSNTHMKYKQRMVELNNKVKEYEYTISKLNVHDLIVNK